MAVYTLVSDEELEAFLSSYSLGPPTSCKGIAEGVENTNFLLKTTAGTFILTLYEKRVAAADLPFFLDLLQHVAARGITCPRPVAQRSGALLGQLAGRPAAIVTFLEGMSVKRASPAHCASVGAALADLHAAAQTFPRQRENALGPAAWRPLFMKSAASADRVLHGLSREITEELDYLEAHWPRGLPHGVIHADLFQDNVFFLEGRLSGLIDFYFACNDFLSYDLAICLNAWCFEPDYSFNLTKGRALLEAYARRRPLAREERAALPVLARGAALRFLLTRLDDWLTTPEGALVVKKDPLEYLRKLRFHRSARTAGAYGLDGEALIA